MLILLKITNITFLCVLNNLCEADNCILPVSDDVTLEIETIGEF